MKTIIILSGVPYSFLKQRPHHFSVFFVQQGYRVIYLSITDIHSFSPNELLKIECQDSFMDNFFEKNDDKIYIVKKTLKKVPLKDSDSDALTNKIAALFKEDKVTYIASFPAWINYLTTLPSKGKLIYDCLDDWSCFLKDIEIGYKEDLLYAERKIASSADLVITSAKRLYIKMAYLNDQVYYLPNGVWCTDYSKQLSVRNDVPNDLETIKKPIVFFMGSVSEWVDIDLINYISKSRPNYSFVFVGHERTKLPSHPNIFFLGTKNYEELPQFIAQAKVAIIPFKVNNLTAAVTPLKLYEYLGASTPVVTTIMPDIIELNGTKTAFNHNEFLNYLDEYILMDDDSYDKVCKQARETAESYDWNCLLEPICNFIDESNFFVPSKDRFVQEIIGQYSRFEQNHLIKNELLGIYNLRGQYESSCSLFKLSDAGSEKKEIDYEKLALAYIKKGDFDQAVQLTNWFINNSNKLLFIYTQSLLAELNKDILLEIFLLKSSGNTYEALKIAESLFESNHNQPKVLGLLAGLYIDIGEYSIAFELVVEALANNQKYRVEEILDIFTISYLITILIKQNQYDLAEEIVLSFMNINKEWEEKSTELLSRIYISKYKG